MKTQELQRPAHEDALTLEQVATLTGVKHSAVSRTASLIIGGGQGTGSRRAYTFRDATVIRAVSDLNGRTADDKHINGHLYRALVAEVRTACHGVETVTASLGPITVVYRPTWYGPDDLA